MDLVAKWLLALLVIQAPPEPRITWFFHAQSCQACLDHQLEIMKDYFRDGDRVVVYLADELADRAATSRLKKRIQSLRADIFVKSQIGTEFGVGFLFEDALPGETIKFLNAKGSYNHWRAREILKLVR